jgi:hypothetical protein
MCVDYRTLNKNSKKDSYALPRIEELLDCLSGNRFFSVIDMKSGFIFLAWINLYTFFRDDMSNELYFSLEEFPFLW